MPWARREGIRAPQSVSESGQHRSDLGLPILFEEQHLQQLLLGGQDVREHVTGLRPAVAAPDEETVSRNVIASQGRVVGSGNGAPADRSHGGLSDLMAYRRRSGCQDSIAAGASTQAELDVNVVDE